jgi:alpha-N-acetylglucosaminidase
LDYATKQWAGVVADYFKPRWELFIAELKSALDSGASFNQSAFAIDVFTSVEKPFTLSTKLYSSVPEGEFIYMSIGIMVMNFRLN